MYRRMNAEEDVADGRPRCRRVCSPEDADGTEQLDGPSTVRDCVQRPSARRIPVAMSEGRDREKKVVALCGSGRGAKGITESHETGAERIWRPAQPDRADVGGIVEDGAMLRGPVRRSEALFRWLLGLCAARQPAQARARSGALTSRKPQRLIIFILFACQRCVSSQRFVTVDGSSASSPALRAKEPTLPLQKDSAAAEVLVSLPCHRHPGEFRRFDRLLSVHLDATSSARQSGGCSSMRVHLCDGFGSQAGRQPARMMARSAAAQMTRERLPRPDATCFSARPTSSPSAALGPASPHLDFFIASVMAAISNARD